MPPSLNGPYKSIVNILLTILILVVGAWAANTNLRLDRQDEKLAVTREQVISNQESIEHLIRLVEANQVTLRDIQQRMGRGGR
ncbi:MAG TPA: hypothetical protein VLH56_18915 [Dissulfurispiraceae bacterium]|nr:hypothetical protein [Dissulfurispiraceae bacterium]